MISLRACFFVALTFCAHNNLADAAPTPESPQTSESEVARTNLLLDPDFSQLANSASGPWVISQHAGETSYQFQASEGVVRIERVGVEPWGEVSQRIDASEFAGRNIRFSAELRGQFSAHEGDLAAMASGINVSVKGYRSAKLQDKLLGTRQLDHVEGQPEWLSGKHDWTPHEVEVFVPESASEITVRFRLTRGGWLEARHPHLDIVQNSSVKQDTESETKRAVESDEES